MGIVRCGVVGVIWLLAPHLTLVLGGGLLLLAGSFGRRHRPWGAFCLLILLAAGIGLAIRPADLPDGRWSLLCDPLGQTLQWLGLVLAVLLTLAAWGEQENSPTGPEFFGVLLFSVTALMFAAVADDLVLLFVALELLWVGSGLLLFLSGGSDAVEAEHRRSAVVKHFMLGIVTSGVLFYAFALLVAETGTTHLAGMGAEISSQSPSAEVGHSPPERDSPLAVAACVFILAALGFRMAVVPFQFGTLDIYQGSSNWGAGWMAAVVKATIAVVLMRLLMGPLIALEKTTRLATVVIAGTTMLLPGLLALGERQVRRILTYTSMAHGGFLLLGVVANLWDQRQGEAATAGPFPGGTLFYLVTYALAMAGLFAVLVYLRRDGRPVDDVDELAGLVRREPVAAGCGVILMASLAGLPPLAGFWGRLLILADSLSASAEGSRTMLFGPNPVFLLLGFAGLASILLTSAAYLRIVSVICFGVQAARPQPGGGRPALLAAVLATGLIVGFGLAPALLLRFMKIPSILN